MSSEITHEALLTTDVEEEQKIFYFYLMLFKVKGIIMRKKADDSKKRSRQKKKEFFTLDLVLWTDSLDLLLVPSRIKDISSQRRHRIVGALVKLITMGVFLE